MSSNLVKSIARNIVAVINHAPNPVSSFAYIEAKVPGFAETDPSHAWTFEFDDEDGDPSLLWDGMTAAGRDALGIVLREGRVALTPLSQLIYLLENRWPHDPAWVPMGLARANLANLSGQGRLFYLPEEGIEEIMRMARAQGNEAEWTRLDVDHRSARRRA